MLSETSVVGREILGEAKHDKILAMLIVKFHYLQGFLSPVEGVQLLRSYFYTLCPMTARNHHTPVSNAPIR